MYDGYEAPYGLSGFGMCGLSHVAAKYCKGSIDVLQSLLLFLLQYIALLVFVDFF